MVDLVLAKLCVRMLASRAGPSFSEQVTRCVAILIMISSLAAGQGLVGADTSLPLAFPVGVVHNTPPPLPRKEPIFAVPYLFVESDLNVNGDGYQALSPAMRAGFDMEGRHLSIEISGTYDFVRKTNDNDQVPDEKGRARRVDSQLLYKFRSGSSWFVLAGAGWAEASMTPYMKSNWAPSAGAGRDFGSESDSWRLQFSYLHAMNEIVRYPTLIRFTPGPGQSALSHTCSLCGNGIQGISASLQYPSPRSSAHWFMLMSLQTDWFHETVTDPYNLSMTQNQKNQRSTSGSFSAGLIYRFDPMHPGRAK